MARGDFTFCHPLRVRWAEVDRQGIVFNGNYLHYFDVGITEYWRAIGCPYPDGLVGQGSDLFVKKATVEYHAPAGYDDVLDVCVRVARIGRSSLQFRPRDPPRRRAPRGRRGHLRQRRSRDTQIGGGAGVSARGDPALRARAAGGCLRLPALRAQAKPATLSTPLRSIAASCPELPDARTRTPHHAASRQALHRRPVGGLCSCRSPRCSQRFHRASHWTRSGRLARRCGPGRVRRPPRAGRVVRDCAGATRRLPFPHPRRAEGARRRDRPHDQRGGRHAAQDGAAASRPGCRNRASPCTRSWPPSSHSKSRSATRA